MENLSVDLSIIIVGFVITGLTTFFSTRAGLKQHTNEKFEKLNDQLNGHVRTLTDRVHRVELQNQDLLNKLEIQREVVSTFKLQILDNLPRLYTMIEHSIDKKKEKKRG